MKGHIKNRFDGTYILNPSIKLIGAKTKNRDILYQYFPEEALKRYIEPFGGTFGVLIGKPPAGVEIAGDINPYVINYYKILQTDPEGFFESFQGNWNVLEKHGKCIFEQMKYKVTREYFPVNRATFFYIITKVCMNGIWRLNKLGECNSSYCGTTTGRGIFNREWFDLILKRIKDVQFTNNDYKALLHSANDVDPINTFVFCDPPYVPVCEEVPDGCVTTYNGIKWTPDDYRELQWYLNQARYKWMLTINDCQFIRDLFRNYIIMDNSVYYSCSQTPAGRGQKKELIITNYAVS